MDPTAARGVTGRAPALREPSKPGGPTVEERAAVRYIAAGQTVEGCEDIHRKTAREALPSPWLRGSRNLIQRLYCAGGRFTGCQAVPSQRHAPSSEIRPTLDGGGGGTALVSVAARWGCAAAVMTAAKRCG